MAEKKKEEEMTIKDVVKVKDERKKAPKKEKKKEQKKEEKEEIKKIDDPFKILKFVLMTEKAVQSIEMQNKLVFIVDRKADKKNVKEAAQSAFESEISGVKTMIDQKGRKKAFIKFKEEGAAGEIAIRLGII